MNFFEIFNDEKFYNTPIIKDGENIYSLSDIRKFVFPLYKNLTENAANNVLINTDNIFDFFIFLIASIYADKEIYIADNKRISLMSDIKYIELKKLSREKKEGEISPHINLDKIYINLFTSGTTGVPKKIQKNVSNILYEAKDIYEECIKAFFAKKAYIQSTSVIYHMFDLTVHIFLVLYNPLYLALSAKRVNYPEDIKDEILISTPSFLDKIKKYSIIPDKNLKVILSAGDKLNKETFSYIENSGVKVFDIYGCSEFGVIGYKDDFNNDYMKTFNSVRLIKKGKSVYIKSPYFINNEDILSDDTEIKDERHFILKKRTDRILKIQEKRISASEIEGLILKSGFVDDVYCFKFEDKLACLLVLNKKGEEIYLKKGKINLVKILKADVLKNSEIAPQKWRVLHEIIKTETGKISKDKIEELFNINLTFPYIKNIKKESDYAKIELIFPYFANFFKGHFENMPILPGVVQLYFAKFYIKNLFDLELDFASAKKIKFSRIIKPDIIIELEMKKKDDEIIYVYKKDDIIYSSGAFYIKRESDL